jgi:tRNA modification GTPase
MILSHDEHPIIAQCTPKGSGALALLRLTGLGAIEVAHKISSLALGKQLITMPTHTIHVGFVVDSHGNHIDQVLFLLMRAPHTFTGQDTVEITCHNNPFIIESIIAQAIAHGARPAKEGEFTKRAVLSKKIDITQAEAINELIHANTQLSLKKSLAQLSGSLSHWVSTIEKQLTHALALSEASFEFIDEEESFGKQIKEIIDHVLITITTVKDVFNQQQQLRQGIRIAIIGSVNAGKSSLFNALLKQERSIVTHIAGTTRDVIEAGLYRNSNYWTLVDTAGLRQTHDIIEQEGIKRSFEQADLADIILLVIDHSRVMHTQERNLYQELCHRYQHKIIGIYHKTDLPIAGEHSLLTHPLFVSSKTPENIEQVEQAIQKKITQLFRSLETPFLLNQRQYNVLCDVENKLKIVQSMLVEPVQYELLSYHLNDILMLMSELTGKSISEQAMDEIFRNFCIGK